MTRPSVDFSDPFLCCEVSVECIIKYAQKRQNYSLNNLNGNTIYLKNHQPVFVTVFFLNLPLLIAVFMR